MLGGPCKALFVGGANIINNTTDGTIFNYITSLGYGLEYIKDSNTTSSSWVGRPFVFISDSCSAPNLGTKFLNATCGVILQERNSFPAMKFHTNNGQNAGSETQVRITAAGAAHPISGGTPAGVTTIFSSTQALNVSSSSGSFGPGVVLVAERVSNSNQRAIFAYDTGAQMTTGFIAPGRRVATFISSNATTIANLTTAAQNMFNATLSWVYTPTSATEDCAGVCDGSSILDCDGVCYDPNVQSPSSCIRCDGTCGPCCDGSVYEDCSGNCNTCVESKVAPKSRTVVIKSRRRK